MALIGSENESQHRPLLYRAALSPGCARWLNNRDDRSLAQRVASTTFFIRIFAAGLAFFSQVLLARWMGTFEFGIFVYVFTWVMVIGAVVDFGLASSAQRFIPQYSEKGASSLLSGFLSGSRWLVFWSATASAIAAPAAHLSAQGLARR